MATTTKRFTYEDLEAIPQEHEGDRHELIDGKLVVTRCATPHHQLILVRILSAIVDTSQERDSGVALPSVGVRFSSDNVLVPDVCFVARDRQHVIGPKVIDAAPDLVVEILSADTRGRDLATKRAVYARFGVLEYWIVDREDRIVTVLALTGDQDQPISVGLQGQIHSKILPGFTVTVEHVFADVR